MTEAAYEYRYTDRDVRENPELTTLVVAYVKQYGGDFEPLLDAKRAVEDGSDLTVPQVRKVLNCMRHDYAVADSLPAPVRPVVLDFGSAHQRKTMQKEREIRKKQCDKADSHYMHTWGKSYNLQCDGVPFKINRKDTDTKATIKVKYVKAKGGRLVHLVNLDSTSHSFRWSPPRHQYGFGYIDLDVKLVCRFPSWIKNGALYQEEPVHLYNDPGMPVGRCPHCFTK